ncbi:MAG: hypothetical protein JHC33_15540 [Ignisphaera sp.]|nr:hypothetical protein [Ignisphaera sp.]
MARTGNLYCLTSPTGQVGMFHQLGSTIRERVCVQNCLVEKFGRGKVTIGRGLFIVSHTNTIAMAKGGVGYFDTPDGAYLVERVTPSNPRYLKSPVIQEYSDFFGRKITQAVVADVPVKTSKAGKAVYHTHMRAVKLLNELLDTLGYVRAEPNVVAFSRAAKRKK